MSYEFELIHWFFAYFVRFLVVEALCTVQFLLMVVVFLANQLQNVITRAIRFLCTNDCAADFLAGTLVVSGLSLWIGYRFRKVPKKDQREPALNTGPLNYVKLQQQRKKAREHKSLAYKEV